MPSAHATFSVVYPIARVYFCPSYAIFDLLCDSVFATVTTVFDRNVKIGIHYSTLELLGDIRTTESTHCTSLNNKNIYPKKKKTHIVILRIWKQ